jgi:hypothetical protein
VSKRIALCVAAVMAVTGLAVSAATASPKKPTVKQAGHLLVGINDEADTLYGDPLSAFNTLRSLKTQVLRVNLYWGGTKWAVANKARPDDPTDPGDPAYDWALYDRLVMYAQTYNIQLVFSILFTPKWANGGKGKNIAPKNFKDLENFAYAAAERYSGLWIPPTWQQNASLGIGNMPLPKVNMWTAWNEPNNPVFLSPQYKRVGKSWRVESAYQYARICNAVMAGVHSKFLGPLSDEHVACGVTDPKGNDAPRTRRASVDPLTFFVQAHRFGMKDFDVYAHHPYADRATEKPSYVPKGKFKRRIQLGNINLLLKQISRYYGPKHLWITEYGYQTNPPKKGIFGTSWKNQATYMAQAYALARKNRRIDMMLWFMVRDDPNLRSGWQSGLMTVSGKKKPSWKTFVRLPRGTA